MRLSKPVKLIASLPFGRRFALRAWNRVLMHLAPRQQATTYFGAIMQCDVHDMIQATIIHFGAWEPEVSRHLASVIRPGDTVVDVGANIGYYSLLFAKAVGPDGRVVAIEALPKLGRAVEEHAVQNGIRNIRVANVAASSDVGQVAIYEAPPTNIGMTTTRSDRGFPAAGVVPALPLAQILTAEELDEVSLIKIDIEGAEVPVVRCLLDDWQRFPRLRSLVVEASTADNPEWQILFGRLKAMGFAAYDLHNDYDWLSMLNGERREPTSLELLPGIQTDILFTMDPI